MDFCAASLETSRCLTTSVQKHKYSRKGHDHAQRTYIVLGSMQHANSYQLSTLLYIFFFTIITAQVADRWLAVECVKACTDTLCNLSDLQFPLATLFTSASALLYSKSLVDELITEATARLLFTFGDALSVMRNVDKIHELIELPHGAMLALLESVRLETDSETTLLLLLQAWIDGNRENCDREQWMKLGKQIRYSKIPTAYLSMILPNMPDLCISLDQRNDLHMLLMTQHDPESWGCCRPDILNATCPWSWLYCPLRPWPNRSEPNKYITLKLKVKQSELLAHVNAMLQMHQTASERWAAYKKKRAETKEEVSTSSYHDREKPAEEVAEEEEEERRNEIWSTPTYCFGYNWSLGFTTASEVEAFAVGLRVSWPRDPSARVAARCRVRLIGPNESRADPDLWCHTVLMSNSSFYVSGFIGAHTEVEDFHHGLNPWLDFLIDGFLSFEADICEVEPFIF